MPGPPTCCGRTRIRPRGKRKAIPSQGASQAASRVSLAQAAPATSASPGRVATSVGSAATAVDVPAVEREVQDGLDGLKDKLFRLELRRQAGTISEEEYAQERARAEKVLRDLVRG